MKMKTVFILALLLSGPSYALTVQQAQAVACEALEAQQYEIDGGCLEELVPVGSTKSAHYFRGVDTSGDCEFNLRVEKKTLKVTIKRSCY